MSEMSILRAIEIADFCRKGISCVIEDDELRAATQKLAEAKLHGSHEDAAEEMLRRGLR